MVNCNSLGANNTEHVSPQFFPAQAAPVLANSLSKFVIQTCILCNSFLYPRCVVLCPSVVLDGCCKSWCLIGRAVTSHQGRRKKGCFTLMCQPAAQQWPLTFSVYRWRALSLGVEGLEGKHTHLNYTRFSYHALPDSAKISRSLLFQSVFSSKTQALQRTMSKTVI